MENFKIVHDVTNNEVKEIKLTATEIAQRESESTAAIEAKSKQDTDKAAAEAAKAALLAKLGITADEAKLLLS